MHKKKILAVVALFLIVSVFAKPVKADLFLTREKGLHIQKQCDKSRFH